jgi:IclR family pca regulon transcriptional regulator
MTKKRENSPSTRATASGRPRSTTTIATKEPLPSPSLARQIIEQIDICEGDPSFMTSLARGLAVLSTFTRHTRELTMSQISLETGIPRAAVRRALYTLGKLGYVGEQGRGFVLLPRVLGIGNAYLSSASLTTTAQPILDSLRDAVRESCSLGILDGDEVLYVARAETVRIMSIGLRPGSRLPAYCTSMGRILLANLAENTLASYLARIPLRPRTERTVTDPQQLLDLFDKVRRNNVAIIDQELEIGLRSVAVPVRNREGDVIAALNVGTQTGRATLHVLEAEILPELRRAAARLEALLG